MIDSTRLSSFVAFAEELNFTRAAARLHISQPALHVQIQKLAEEVGAPLYRRVGRALELTGQGREVLAFGRELHQRTETFRASLAGHSAERVVLAAGEGALLYVLGPAVRKMARTSGVLLRVLTRDRDGTLAALASAEANLGVTALEVVPESLQATLLRRAGMLVVVPRTHRLARKRRVALADLARERLIVPPANRPHRQFIARALDAAGVPWEVAVEAGGWELMLNYAAAGVGLAVVNDICRIPAGAVARPLSGMPALSYYLLHSKRAPLMPGAAELKRLIGEAFAT